MKNPLRKRLIRELKGDFGKYLVIFLFLILTIGFISGFLVAGNSMIQAYDDSFEKYYIENGHFVLTQKASEELIRRIEEERVTLYTDYYVEEETDSRGDGETDSILRIYYDRQEHNTVCLMQGELPQQAAEIAIDRMYAENNGVSVGDTITCGGKELTVTGLIALPDYSALFSSTTDMMFDAVKFGVAVMTEEGFSSFGDTNLNYCYAWYYENSPEDEIEEKSMSDDLMGVIAEQAYAEGNSISLYLPRYINSAINFTGDDMGGDRSMMIVLLYILIVILGFVFAITTSHTITKESAVIGTLRASGYTKGELLRHYMTLPVIVTFAAAIVGNALGYTVFYKMSAALYYNSYSLTTFTPIWNAEAFLLTTVVPVLLMFVINLLVLVRSLRHTPLEFLRHDLGSKKHKKSLKLPNFRFLVRFRLRIILQNLSNYVTLFVGIFFASVLLLFGLMMSPLLKHYEEQVLDNMFSKYQYVLKAPVETEQSGAEKYCAGTVKITMEDMPEEDAAVYGVSPDSSYIPETMPEEGVLISDGFAEKYKLREGDTVTVREAYGKKTYELEVKGTIVYPAALAVFMSTEEYEEIFDVEEGYYNGYFSDEKLEDIEEAYIASCITEDDLTKTSRQLDLSMGNMFYLFCGFAVIIYLLLIYLLTKLIIERNTTSISMVKILGYENREIAGLYLLATTWMVVLFLLISMVLATWVIGELYFAIMKDYNGWLNIYIAPKVYGEMFGLGLVSYLVVALLQLRKIKRIPMDEALKNVE